jgi:hypothetical protein
MRKIIFLFYFVISTTTFAATQIAEIQGFLPYSRDGKEVLIFKLDNNVQEGCNDSARFAIDETSPRYKTTVSAVLAAFHSKTPITVAYLPTCNTWYNAADVNYICVGNADC